MALLGKALLLTFLIEALACIAIAILIFSYLSFFVF